jgi:hypothetical protein
VSMWATMEEMSLRAANVKGGEETPFAIETLDRGW